MFPSRPSIVFIGSVESSCITLRVLLKLNANIVAVFGLAAEYADGVVGYRRLDDLARTHTVPYFDFARINDSATIAQIATFAPDTLWVIGLSQIIGSRLLSIPGYCAIGFHPTRLPVGRGRAALAWSIIADIPLAATFFQIDAGVDSGEILAQVEVPLELDDDLQQRYHKLYAAIPSAVDELIHSFASGTLMPRKQDERQAIYLGTRRPSDGTIDWHQPAEQVVRLIRASAYPHPGAWTAYRDIRIQIDKCQLFQARSYVLVPGRIAEVSDDDTFIVGAVNGAVRIISFAAPGQWKPQAGMLLGSNVQHELYQLRHRVRALEDQIADLNRRLAVGTSMHGAEGEADGQ